MCGMGRSKFSGLSKEQIPERNYSGERGNEMGESGADNLPMRIIFLILRIWRMKQIQGFIWVIEVIAILIVIGLLGSGGFAR